jgi:hypothetical protein
MTDHNLNETGRSSWSSGRSGPEVAGFDLEGTRPDRADRRGRSRVASHRLPKAIMKDSIAIMKGSIAILRRIPWEG